MFAIPGAPAQARISQLCGAVLTALLCLAGGAHADPRTTADGVYTAEQARQGEQVHQKYCANCHHVSYYQGPFLIAWQNQPVASLFDLIQMKMPQDRPGALKPREYAAFLAYLFEMNDLPAGETRLGSKREEMQDILITRAQ
ncbi:MAG: hypothetical protein RIB46_18710 [Pseudomonadales bacterium]